MSDSSNDGGVVVDLAILKPFPGNAKTHDDALLQESVAELGQYRPIVVARSDDPEWNGVILAGNGTADAVHATGAKTIRVTYVDGNEAKFRKINLIDNRANDRGGYEKDKLLDLLQHDLITGDLLATGYTDADIEKILADSLPPDFEPDGEQPSLDTVKPRECPSCGYKWRVDGDGNVHTVEQ